MLSLFLTWYANFLDYKPNEISLAVVVTLIGALLTRMTVFYLARSQEPNVLNQDCKLKVGDSLVFFVKLNSPMQA